MLASGNTMGQTLLFPERLVLSADDVELLGENYDNFVAFGFDYTIQDANTVEFSTLPADVSLEMLEEVVYDMIDTFRDGVNLSEKRRRENAAMLLSRTRNLKALSQAEVEALLVDLRGCADCSLTPDGRPVVKVFEEGEVRNLF